MKICYPIKHFLFLQKKKRKYNTLRKPNGFCKFINDEKIHIKNIVLLKHLNYEETITSCSRSNFWR